MSAQTYDARTRQAATAMTVLAEITEYWDGYAERLQGGDAQWGSRDFFRNVKEGHDKAFAFSNRLAEFPAQRGKSVLSICCGVGIDALEFAKCGAEVTFVSPSPKINELTRAYFGYEGLDATIDLCAAEALPFAAESFDVVDARSILMYTPSPETVIAEIHRVLKPRGFVIAHLYNRRSWYAILAKLSGAHLIQAAGDPPFSRLHTAGEARRLFDAYSSVGVHLDRFPTRTSARSGLAATLYNSVFVPLTAVLPKAVIRPFGFYIIVKSVK